MKIDRYLLRGTLLPFLAILGVLVALFAGYSLAGTLADAVGGLLPLRVIAALAGLKVLIALDVLIPISLFIAVVVAFGRLQADSEVTAMSSLGIGPIRQMRPVLALATLLAICVACLSLFIRPLAYGASHAISQRAAVMLNVNAMQPGTFYAAADGNQVIFLAGKARHGADAHGVFVARNVDGHTEIIFARHAQPARPVQGRRVVHLSGAHIYELHAGDPTQDKVLQADGMNVSPDGAVPPVPNYSPVTAASLHLRASTSPADIAEWQWRLSTGISTLLLPLLGFALSRTRPRQGRFARFGPAIFAYCGYYLLCTLARTWVEHGEVGAVPGLWWAPGFLALVVVLCCCLPGMRRRFGGARRFAPSRRFAPLVRPQDAA